jgi:predicted amidohydrolase
MVERAADGALRNTSLLIDPDGRIAHTYSKTHLYGGGRGESGVLTPGDAVTSVDTALGRYSSAICYDLRFPALWHTLGLGSPDVVSVVAAWPAKRLDHWRTLTTARALEQQAFLLACAVADHPDGPNYTGHSRVVSPRGEVIAEAGAGPEVLRATIDLDQVAAFRAELPALRDRAASARVGPPSAPEGRNVPVTQLPPLVNDRARAGLVESFTELRGGMTMGEVSLRDAIDEGRR